MQQADLTVSKANQKKAETLFDNFSNGIKRELSRDIKSFGIMSIVKRMLSKSKSDPATPHVVDVIKRMEKDKIHSQVALQLAETASSQMQNMQKIVLIKMIPFLAATLGIIICLSLAATVRPFVISNFDLQKFLIPLLILVPLFIFGSMKRKEAKLDMLAINVLMQAASAFASAKMSGQGTVAAMLNLEQMKRKAEKLNKTQKETAKISKKNNK